MNHRYNRSGRSLWGRVPILLWDQNTPKGSFIHWQNASQVYLLCSELYGHVALEIFTTTYHYRPSFMRTRRNTEKIRTFKCLFTRWSRLESVGNMRLRLIPISNWPTVRPSKGEKICTINGDKWWCSCKNDNARARINVAALLSSYHWTLAPGFCAHKAFLNKICSQERYKVSNIRCTPVF